ncbi:DUF4384 domain-containing protein [Rhizobium sp. BR 249]|uniref:DUF4384 domain-containing protein n=1 Tax=Rhizobium sp. BR 249 TaxID=3040011 RepID=UPI0039BFCC57
MLNRKAILAAATFLSFFSMVPAVEAQNERTLTEAPAQSGPVSITFDRAEAKYAIGEVVGLFIQSTENAYVTVLNVSPNGAVVKLFPNKYQTDALVAPGKRVQVPDPASGARLQVSGPVGQEQIKVFYSSKPLTIFADLGGSGSGMFRSIDGGMDAVSRSLEEARSLGTKISSKTLMLTTVNSMAAVPPVAVAPAAKPTPAAKPAPVEQAAKPPKPAAAPKPKPVVKQEVAKKPEPVIEKPKKPAPKPVEQATSQPPKKYKIVTNLAPGQELAADELELIGPATGSTSNRPAQSSQSSQTKMPKLPMPQIKMPQFKLPGGFGIKMPQINLGRSAEPEAAGESEEFQMANADTPVCNALLDKLNTAVAAKDINAAATEADAIAVSADCGQFQINAQRRVAALRLAAAQEMMAADKPVADYEPLLVAADSPQVLWQASATLGEIYFSARRFADAAADYQQAIEIIKNETRTPKAPPADTISDLIQRAAQARILAANPTSDNPQGSFVPAEKDHRSGVLGGIYSQNVRGIVPVSIPVPITFDFDKSTFTSIGTEAAQELLEALKEQNPGRIILIGHTDRRGGDDYNQKLSERRAQAVADFLKSHGIDATIDAEGRGSSEPVDVTATANLTEDDIDALNRRVEWRRE